MQMADWLSSGIQPPTGEVLEYLEYRGLTPELHSRVNVGMWATPNIPAPDPGFRGRCGPVGEKILGRVVLPSLTPRGEIIGIEARSLDKTLTGYRVPGAKWAPYWVTTSNAMEALWSRSRVWIVEGFFDLVALVRVVPSQDVVISTLRAGINQVQVEHLRRFCKGGVIIAYDNDETGRKAAIGYQEDNGRRRFGAIDHMERAGLHVTRCRYIGKDPGEVWLSKGDQGLMRAFGAY